MHVYGKLVIDVSLFIKTESEEDAIGQAVDKVNYFTLENKAKLLELLKTMEMHDADIQWEEVVPA